MELSVAEWLEREEVDFCLFLCAVGFFQLLFHFQRNATATTKGLKYSAVKTIDLKRKTKS